MTLALENDWGDQPLDLGGLVLGLLTLLDDQGALDNVLPDIVLLGQVEKLPDLGSALGTETSWDSAIGQAGDLSLTFLDDGHGENGQVSVNDASADGFTLALTGTALAVAGVALAEKKADTAGSENSLLHGESLLVVASGDAEDVALPFVTQGGGINLHAHTLLVEGTDLELLKSFKLEKVKLLVHIYVLL